MGAKKRVREGGAPSSHAKPTLKQQLFITHFTDPESTAFGNATRAAELAGYRGQPGSTQLAVQGHANLRNSKVRQAIERALDKAGCTLELAAKRLRQGLDAKQVRVALVDKEFVYSNGVPDFRERRQAAELLFRLRGMQPVPHEEREAPKVFEQAPPTQEELRAAMESSHLAKQEDALRLCHADSVLRQLRELITQTQVLKDEAERQGDKRTALAAIHELGRLTELTANVCGELDERAQTKIINMNLDPESGRRIAETFLARHKPKGETSDGL